MNLRVDFKKIIHYFKRQKRGRREINVFRDWHLILISFFVLLVVIFLIDGYLIWDFQKSLSGRIETERKGTVLIDKDSLQKVVDEIDLREQGFNENLNAPAIKDPSL